MDNREQFYGLAEILEHYFGCKKPFLKKPKPIYTEYGITSHEYFTVNGAKAYGELIDLIYALRNIGALSDKECDSTVDILDIIASSNGY